jgi:hypothetical protein
LVELVDPLTGVVKTFSDTSLYDGLPSSTSTKGIIYDACRNRLWVGTKPATSGTTKMLVMDATSLAILEALPALDGIDQVVFDEKLRIVYAFEGSLGGFEAWNADTLALLSGTGVFPTPPLTPGGNGNTHTGNINPKTHYIYAYNGNAGVMTVWEPIFTP